MNLNLNKFSQRFINNITITPYSFIQYNKLSKEILALYDKYVILKLDNV